MKKLEVILNPKIGRFLIESRKRINVLYGGAGSGKSYTVAQHLLINKLYQEKDIRILVVRKTLPALRITAYQLVLDLLEEYELPYLLNKTEMTILVGRNRMLFKSLDDPEKIKSYEGNYVWIEEASEISHKDFMQLNLRLRRRTNGRGFGNQMFLTFNPINEYHWLNEKLVQGNRKDTKINQSTYQDNIFLDQSYIDELNALKDEDEMYYQIYALGEWGVRKNVIYSNYEIIKAKDWPDSFDETIYGLDFGYNNPSALLQIGFKDEIPSITEKHTGKYLSVYERELLYKTGLTNMDLIKELEKLIKVKTDNIYADSAEPARIEEIGRSGFNIYESDKDVKMGIDYVNRQKVKIHEDSVNHISEKRGYKWKEDKDGHALEEPVKFRNHLQDTERYALYTHLGTKNKRKGKVYVAG